MYKISLVLLTGSWVSRCGVGRGSIGVVFFAIIMGNWANILFGGKKKNQEISLQERILTRKTTDIKANS